VSENKVLRRIDGPKKNEVIRDEKIAQWGASYFVLFRKYY
jgi:hypothetical protein